MNLQSFKKKIEDIFQKNSIDKEEVNILFCESLNCTLAELFAKTEISFKEQKEIECAVKKRLKGMPIQKIFKRAYFFDYVYYVNKNVLCPRPETELLVEECLKFASSDDKIMDLCTGSGCIAITLQKKCGASVVASDISSKALHVAKKNAKRLQANVKFIKSNMFKKIYEKFDIIVSNPPYIASNKIKTLDCEVKNHDPKISLDGGEDGLDFYRIIAKEAKKYLNRSGKILLEIGIGQAEEVKKLLSQNGFDCYVKKDYNDIERIVVGELK